MQIEQLSSSSAAPSVVDVTIARPLVLKPDRVGIHPELRALRQWVCFRLTQSPTGKWTKIPYQPNGHKANTTDRATWSSFDEAWDAYSGAKPSLRFDGVGFVTSTDDPYVLIDLDHVLPDGEGIAEWAQEIVITAEQEGAYIETSISGSGVHIIGRGPQGFKGVKKSDAEIYCHSRYFTITGHSLPLPDRIGDIAATIDTTKARIGQSAFDDGTSDASRNDILANIVEDTVRAHRHPAPVDDEAILRRAREAKNGPKFSSLFDGRTTPYPSASEADLALATILAHWVGPDPKRIERLIRQSALSRPKWNDHRTYLSDTINKAIGTAAPFHDWSNHYGVDRPHPALAGVMQQIAAQNSGVAHAPTKAASVGFSLRTSRSGAIIGDEENLVRILEHDADLTGAFKYNEFSGERIVCMPIPDGRGVQNVIAARGIPRPWRDDDTVALQTYIQRLYIPSIPVYRVEAAVDLVARKLCAFHPVKDYLTSLQWDGVPRLENWLPTYLQATAQPRDYVRAVGKAFLVSAVARIFDPGCKVDSAIVLEGAQGIGKSTTLRILAGDEWFSDSLPADLANKDAKDHLRGKWIIELPELAQFRKSEIETVKSYISRQTERFRPAYGRNEVTIPRQCVFGGSTNDDNYLVDSTGNRRFWAVRCGHADLPGLRRDRDQLWAETVNCYRAGARWHLTGTTLATAAQEAQERVVSDPWLAEVVRVTSNTTDSEMSPGEVLTAIGLAERDRHPASAARVGRLLRDLGWPKGRRHATRGQLYVRPKPDNSAVPAKQTMADEA